MISKDYKKNQDLIIFQEIKLVLRLFKLGLLLPSKIWLSEYKELMQKPSLKIQLKAQVKIILVVK